LPKWNGFQIAMKTLAVTLLTIVQVARKPTPITVAIQQLSPRDRGTSRSQPR
jgi:hypothetical protein